jgi:hypothetical protein
VLADRAAYVKRLLVGVLVAGFTSAGCSFVLIDKAPPPALWPLETQTGGAHQFAIASVYGFVNVATCRTYLDS